MIGSYAKFHVRSSSGFGDISQNVKGGNLYPPSGSWVKISRRSGRDLSHLKDGTPSCVTCYDPSRSSGRDLSHLKDYNTSYVTWSDPSCRSGRDLSHRKDYNTSYVTWSDRSCRSGRDLSHLKEPDSLRVFPDGSLYLSHVELMHAGNYTCHAAENAEVQQTHVLSVQGKIGLETTRVQRTG